ncbi:MAG: 30S ribosomal protein S20 [Candidatus Pacebacteria bacterium]|nr:30S ribosomal protein S20 [Candidatus Paceibacterota bacterium]MBP9840074.1 30S ribosomal protein S20 [Candidatus Paceibacterota bacterium]
MAITKGAKKAHRASLRKRVFNVRRKRALTDETKEVTKAIAAGKAAEAEKLLPAAFKAIDKAAKRGIIKANAADRKKSRLAKAIARVGK